MSDRRSSCSRIRCVMSEPSLSRSRCALTNMLAIVGRLTVGDLPELEREEYYAARKLLRALDAKS